MSASASDDVRFPLREAVRYWEPRRLWYNLALTALCGIWVVRTWPAFRLPVVLPHLPELFVLALLANLCYSSVYLVDLALPPAAPDAPRRWRGWLFAAGTLFALFVTQYWIGDEIYPSVR